MYKCVSFIEILYTFTHMRMYKKLQPLRCVLLLNEKEIEKKKFFFRV